MKKLIDGSGGSTKIVGIATVWEKEVLQNGQPDFYSGVSASSILALPFAVGKIQQVMELMSKFDSKTIFDNRPIYDNGIPTPNAIKNLIIGREYLGTMGNLEKELKKLISKSEYEAYKKSNNPTAIIMATRFMDNKKCFFDLKNDDISYEDAINCIIASSSIAGIVPPVKIMTNYYYDGGYRDHSIGAYVMKEYGITEMISVFSRPYYLKGNNFVFGEKDSDKPKNVKEALAWGWSSHISEVSLNDEQEQVKIADEKNIKLKQYFLPNVLKSLYDTDRKRLNTLMSIAKNLQPDVIIE